jgi:hypothetical protein
VRLERKRLSRDERFAGRFGVFFCTVNLSRVFFTYKQTNTVLIESKYCCVCLRKLSLSAFLKNPLAMIRSKVYVICITYRKKRKKKPTESLLQG